MNWLKLRLMTKSVTSLMKFPRDRNTLMMKSVTSLMKFPKDRNTLTTKNVNSLMKFPTNWNTLMYWHFPKTEIHLQWKVWQVWWNFPKTKIHLQRKVSIVWWNFPKTKIYLQIIWKMWIVWWNFPKSETRLWLTVILKMWLVWCANYTFPTPNGYSYLFLLVLNTVRYKWVTMTDNLHQLSDSHTGCTSIPLPNHSRNIKGGLIVGQWQQNGGVHWSNCRCLPPYS